jgi:protein-tyrosine phosphatase
MPERSARSILFICMGNICRSPMAEGVFLHKLRLQGIHDEYEVDSAGTGGWHAGDPPDHRSEQTAREQGVMLVSRARKVTPRDFEEFDLLVCMDHENAANLEQMGCQPSKIRELMSYHPGASHQEVPDPYYGGNDGFQLMYDLIDQAIDRMLLCMRSNDAR